MQLKGQTISCFGKTSSGTEREREMCFLGGSEKNSRTTAQMCRLPLHYTVSGTLRSIDQPIPVCASLRISCIRSEYAEQKLADLK